MIDYILTPACRAAFPERARALDRLDADDPAFDDLSRSDRAELRQLFAERRRQRYMRRLTRERLTIAS